MKLKITSIIGSLLIATLSSISHAGTSYRGGGIQNNIITPDVAIGYRMFTSWNNVRYAVDGMHVCVKRDGFANDCVKWVRAQDSVPAGRSYVGISFAVVGNDSYLLVWYK
jgi:hypothetical protein